MSAGSTSLEGSFDVQDAFVRRLGPIRRRARARWLLRAVGPGLIAGSIVAIGLMLARPTVGGIPRGLLALGLGPVIASAATWMLRRSSWLEAATLVDDHYRWQDGTSSALEFSSEASPSPMVALQVRGALEKLATALPRDVVPLRAPKGWPVAAGSAAVALGIIAWPLVSSLGSARLEGPRAFALAVQEATQLEDHARQIEEASREIDDPALAAMLAEIRKTVDELKEPGLDLRETLAKLSSLDAKIAAQQKELNLAVVDRQLQALGSALSEVKSLELAGKKLEEAKFGPAADEIEKAGDSPISEGEAKAVGPLVEKSARAMEAKGLDSLAKATKTMAEAVKHGGPTLKGGTKDLAKEIRGHERRRRINMLMAQEQQRLKDSKERCEIHTRNLMEAKKREEEAAKKGGSSGPPDEPKPSSVDKDGEASKKPTSLGAREEVKGLAGEGPSEKESVLVSPDEAGAAKRPSRKVHQKYERLSEAALDQEPIPLGHRRAIRRYFELIRPGSGADVAAPSSEPEAGKPGP